MAPLIDRSERPFRLLALLLVLAGCLALALVWLLGATPPAWYPPCPFHSATGLHCPGCGASRAIHALIHGDFLSALHDNALLIVMLPLLLGWSAVALWRAMRHNQPPLALPHGTAWVVLYATIFFVLVRNLPWWPCTLLAPLS